MRKILIVGNLNEILQKEIILNPAITRILGIVVFSILTAIGAFIYIPLPFTPVPITLQTFFVLLSGLVLGKKDGALSQVSYIMLGILGVPIFAAARVGLISITTGYLAGFVLASWIVGYLAEKKSSLIWVSFILLLSNMLILFLGSWWISIFLHIGFPQALYLGFVPFLIGDGIKIILVLGIYKSIFSKGYS